MASKPTNISVDIEADGPIPGAFSMIALGAVVVDDDANVFYAELAPISPQWDAQALAVSGFTREQTLAFAPASKVIFDFGVWLKQFERPRFWSDNAGFDWQFVNWYCHTYLNHNPFGFSSISLTSLYKGMVKDMTQSFRHLRATKHTHNALDDARGNAEVIRTLATMGMKGL